MSDERISKDIPVHGEGDHKADLEYRKGVATTLSDPERVARKAHEAEEALQDEEEAEELAAAEREGRARAKELDPRELDRRAPAGEGHSEEERPH